MNGYHSKRTRSLRALSTVFGLVGVLLLPRSASAQEALSWARIDFLSNRVQLVPHAADARRANINDVLGIGDALRTARSSRAELRFNDGSLARIGERATFRFTPDTRNFQLNNGTVLLLIPPGRGRSTIQTPNAVTGIQGSALFVRYIPETDTTIVGALTNNPDGPMVLFNRDGTEQQALRANEIGVIEGGQITQLYQFDGTLFWQSSGLAEGFNYLTDSSSTGSDALDAVRQEIREAIAGQKPLNGEGVIENPDSFRRPAPDESATPPVTAAPAATDAQVDNQVESSDEGEAAAEDVPELDQLDEIDGVEEEMSVPEFQGSPAESYLSGSSAEGQSTTGRSGNSLTPTLSPEDAEEEEGETPATVRPTETEKFRPSNDVPTTPSRQSTGAGGDDSDATASGSGDEPTNSIDPLRPSALTAPPDETETEDNASEGGPDTGNVDGSAGGSGTTDGANSGAGGSTGGGGAGAGGGANAGGGAGTDTPVVDVEVIIPVEDTAPENPVVVPAPGTAVVVPPPSEAVVVEPPNESFIAPVSPTEVAPITDELLIDESAAPIISEEMAPPVVPEETTPPAMPEEMAPPVVPEETTPPEVAEPAPAEDGPSGVLL